MKRDDAMLALGQTDEAEAAAVNQSNLRFKSFGEKRDVRVQFLLTKSEYEAMDSKLSRRDNLSDYIRKALKRVGAFD